MTSTTNNSIDLLGAFDSIQIRNEEKISKADWEFCQEQQKTVENMLAALDKWYGIFRDAALELEESHQVKFRTNGSADYRNPYKQQSLYSADYEHCMFLPFKNIEEIVEKRLNTVKVFINNIIRYFNHNYSLSVTFPDINEKELPIDFIPQYMSYVDTVIVHLGGRSFRGAAEEELISRVQSNVHRYDWHPVPEVKGKSIIFKSLISFDSYAVQSGKYRIYRSDIKPLEALCAGLAFFGQDRINGDTGIICGFNHNDINLTDWYPLSTSPAEYIKFYKNGRVDVKFSDAASAEDCYRKLKLHEL